MQGPTVASTLGYGLIGKSCHLALRCHSTTNSSEDPAQYILADPRFRPEDLLQLPPISKSDYQWGCYVDLFTDRGTGLVVGWYTSSATARGNSSWPGGPLRRLFTYFPATTHLDLTYNHARWLARLSTPSCTINANFRRVTDAPIECEVQCCFDARLRCHR